MTAPTSSIFDRGVEQALAKAEWLMGSLCDAALTEPLPSGTALWLQERRAVLPLAFASRLKLAVSFASQDRIDANQALLGTTRRPVGGTDGWSVAFTRLRERTALSHAALAITCRPLRKKTEGWRHGNPLRPSIYLDTLHSTLVDHGMPSSEAPAFLEVMVAALGEYLAQLYAALDEQARIHYAHQLQQADERNTPAQLFARRVRSFFAIPQDCPVGAVKAYKRLLPVLEKVAAAEPEFFTNPGHAARCLMQSLIDQAVAIKRQGDAAVFPVFSARVDATVTHLSSLSEPTGADFAEELQHYEASPPVLADEWDSSGWSSSLDDDTDSELLTATASHAAPDSLQVVADIAVNTLPLVSQLQPGMDVDFLSQGQWQRKRLSWVSPQRMMFLFTAQDGASQTVTRRMLEKLSQEQAIRLQS